MLRILIFFCGIPQIPSALSSPSLISYPSIKPISHSHLLHHLPPSFTSSLNPHPNRLKTVKGEVSLGQFIELAEEGGEGEVEDWGGKGRGEFKGGEEVVGGGGGRGWGLRRQRKEGRQRWVEGERKGSEGGWGGQGGVEGRGGRRWEEEKMVESKIGISTFF